MQKQYRTQTNVFREEEDDVDVGDNTKSNEWNNTDNKENILFGKKPVKTNEGLNKSFQAPGRRDIIKPGEIDRLRIGDHVAWHRSYIIYHHAIVIDIDVKNHKIEVIHFTKNKVVREWIDLDDANGTFYRINYPEDIIENNPVDKVLQRAKEGLGKTDYSLFKNNCEHFATYCKTGKAVSHQVYWAKWKAIESAGSGAILGMKSAYTVYKTARQAGKECYKSIAKETAKVAKSGGKIARALVNEARKQGSKSLVDSTAKVATSETVEKVSKSSNRVGAGLLVAFEVGTCAYDIYQMNKKKKEGKISDRDYNMNVTQRVAEGTVGTALSIPGGIYGEQIGGWIGGYIGSAVPVVGTAVGAFVGSFVGGLVGSLAGKAIGSVFGSWLGSLLW